MSKVPEISAVSPFFYTAELFESAYGHSLAQPLHRHCETTELLLVLEGTVQCRMGGQLYTAPAGNALMIPFGTWHELATPARQQQSGYRLSFKSDPFLPSAEGPLITPVSDLPGIKALFVCLEQEKEKQHSTGPGAYHLIGLILALISNGPAPAISNEAKAIQEIKYYMEENHWRSLTLENLAERFNVNKYQLSRTFKQYMGIPPLQYLISCRLEAAKQLLAATDYPAVKIAQAIGYKSVTQFQAAFKKAVGSTPRQYRLAQRITDCSSQ